MLKKVFTKIRQSLNWLHAEGCPTRVIELPHASNRAALQRSGFTLAELMIATTVLALILTFSIAIYLNFFWSTRNLKAANLVYEEARFTMERIVKEVRNGTIDYEEYYNQNLANTLPAVNNHTYAQDYCLYSRQFYSSGPDGEIGTSDDESTGVRLIDDENIPPAIGKWDGGEVVPTPIQNDLFLINVNGNKRSYIKRIEKKDDDNNMMGKVGILKMTGYDFGIDHINAVDPDLDSSTTNICPTDAGENDGRIDTWLCDDGFDCEDNNLTTFDCPSGIAGHTINSRTIFNNPATEENSFVDITPASLDIVDLKFYVSPMDDPRKAYNDNSVQVQPHVTIKMIARANPKLTAQFKSGRTPDITLESTVSTRAQNMIITECNLRQCVEGAFKPCPLSVGVCGPNPLALPPAGNPAQQECQNFVWSGCSIADYTDYADSEWGAGSYQAGSEYASCGDDTCINDFCTDDMDNDCDGLTDEDDPECKFYICNDGLYDTNVESADGCIDVGGLCNTIRPLETEETTCYDGYDNDCDGFADQFDEDCIAQYCSNGKMDPGGRKIPNSDAPNYFLRADYPTKNYLLNADNSHTDSSLNEICIDVGPLCPNTTTPASEIAGCAGDFACERIVCSDGYDNDCDGHADELDDDCIPVICNDTKQNCDLINTDYNFAGDPNISEDYLKNYFNTTCDTGVNELDETCHNIGGVCDGYWNNDATTYFDHTYLGPDNDGTGGRGENNTVTASSAEIIANPDDLCNDGLDNDCDGDIDWEDADCCQDSDGDGYIGEYLGGGTNFCFIEQAKSAGALIDCNDSDANIGPDEAEVCDGAKYTSGPLTGQNIDNNCSYINDLSTSDSDLSDPECCVDTDGDGYGVADAFLSCTNNSAPDCDDSDGNINPSVFESSASGNCMNEDTSGAKDFPINDNCAHSEITYNAVTTTVPHANHIDWYADKNAGWLTWYAGPAVENFDISGLSGEIGIQAAHLLHLYADSCCPSTVVTEICDDVANSDENCNGLEGNNDHYCVNDDKRTFYDYFSDSAHGLSLDSANGVIQNVNPGEITLSMASDEGTVTSGTLSDLDLSACTTSYDITISATESMPNASDITYQLSGDGGAEWCIAGDCSGTLWDNSPLTITIDTSGNPSATDVRWRAKLTGDDPTSSIPILSDISIDITNCS